MAQRQPGQYSLVRRQDGRITLETDAGGEIDLGFGTAKVVGQDITIERPDGSITKFSVGSLIASSAKRQEYVELNKPRSEFKVDVFLNDQQQELWHTFFSPYTVVQDMVVKTPGFEMARDSLWTDGFVTITGHPGDGKTCMAEWLVTHFLMSPAKMPVQRDNNKEYFASKCLPGRDQQTFECVVVKTPNDWTTKVDVSKHQIVLIDDIFGPACVNMHTIRQWKSTLIDISAKVKANPHRLLVIICLHKTHFEKLPFELTYLDLFRKQTVVDLSEEKHAPDQLRREYIMKGNGGYRGLDYRERSQLNCKPVKMSFPYVARLFASVKSFSMEGPKFFNKPFTSFKTAIQKVQRFNKIIYFTLAVGVLFDGELDLDKDNFEDFTANQQQIIRALQNALEVEDVTLAKMRYAATLLYGIFFQPTGKHCWRYTHERSLHAVAETLISKIPKVVLNVCSSDFFITRVRSSYYPFADMVSAIQLSPNEYPELCQRFTFEILSGNLNRIADHPLLDEDRFVSSWFDFMNEMGSLLPVVQQKGTHNRSLFFWSTLYGHANTVDRYLKHADLEELREEEWFKDEMKAGVLATCASTYGSKYSHKQVLQLLHKAGAALEISDSLTDEEIDDLYGFDVSFLIKMNAPLIHIAALRSEDTLIEYLILEGKADVNATTPDGYTPCHRAAFNSKDDAIRTLIRNKADPDVVAPNGRRPLHLAILHGNGSVVQTLSINSVKMECGPMFDGTSTMTACVLSRDDYLIRQVADYRSEKDPHKLSGDLMAPLHTAAAMGDTDTLKRLLDREVKPSVEDNMGWTALHYAVYFHQEAVISMLLEKKADINATTRSKKTPLHIAAEQGYFKICETLLDHGASCDIQTHDNEFPFSSAAKAGYVGLARYLVRQGLILSTPEGGSAGDLEDPIPFDFERDRWYMSYHDK